MLLMLAAAGSPGAAETTASSQQQLGAEVQVFDAQQQRISDTTTTYTTWMQKMINGLGACGQNKKFYDGNSSGTCI